MIKKRKLFNALYDMFTKRRYYKYRKVIMAAQEGSPLVEMLYRVCRKDWSVSYHSGPCARVVTVHMPNGIRHVMCECNGEFYNYIDRG